MANEILGTHKTSQGQLYYLKGRMRLEIASPDKSMLLVDGKHIWFENQIDENNKKINVSKTSMSRLSKAHTVVAALFDAKKALKHFKITDNKTKADLLVVELKPIKSEASEIIRLEMQIVAKTIKLKQVTYWDDRENEVRFSIGKVEKLNGDAEKLFAYSPPKGAEIVEF